VLSFLFIDSIICNYECAQVAALMEWPALADLAPGVFPADVVARAKELSAEIGSVGAYSHSLGVPFIRKSVAKFIEGACAFHTSASSLYMPCPPFLMGALARCTRFSLYIASVRTLASPHSSRRPCISGRPSLQFVLKLKLRCCPVRASWRAAHPLADKRDPLNPARQGARVRKPGVLRS
jgi:hypothetical protein